MSTEHPRNTDYRHEGPNQCAPILEGRFRKSENSCSWVASDRGADQCRPASGRFKREGQNGSQCVWNGTDTGPDQCNPRTAR